MEDKLTKEEVMHVASLAHIEISAEELANYQVKLKQLLNEVEKIKDVKNYDEDIMIAPPTNECALRDDVVGPMLEPAVALKNTPRKSGNYIEVPVVINEEA